MPRQNHVSFISFGLLVTLALLASGCAPFGKTSDPSSVANSALGNSNSGGGGGGGGGSGTTNTTPSPNPTPQSTSNGPAPTPIPAPIATPIPTSVTPFNSLPDGPGKYDLPWLSAETVAVIDAYEGNSINWSEMATDSKVAAVIHRSSIGLRADTAYVSRKVTGQKAGYLWGAYHLGTSDDPIAQAKFFLSTVGSDPTTLLFLDLEDTSSSSMMNVANSVVFMQYIYQTTGRLPIIYANNSVTEALTSALAGNTLFQKTRLWYARFVSQISNFPTGLWTTYFLWQFSSEINCSATGSCPLRVTGTSYDMDINVFYGSKAALASQWHN